MLYLTFNYPSFAKKKKKGMFETKLGEQICLDDLKRSPALVLNEIIHISLVCSRKEVLIFENHSKEETQEHRRYFHTRPTGNFHAFGII